MSGMARRAAGTLDWPSLARLLTEKSATSLLVVDRTGRIRLVSPAASKALGWPRHELEGADCVDRLAPPSLTTSMRSWLRHALLLPVGEHECEVISSDGRLLHLEVETAAVGEERDRSLLVEIRTATEAVAAAVLAVRDPSEIEYEVSLAPLDFGMLLSGPGGARVDLTAGARSCHQALFNQGSPCADCPLRRPEAEPWPRVAVRPVAAGFQVISAERVDPQRAAISVRALPERMLAALNEAKIRHLADQAQLSDRERAVLHYLLLGRTLEDIGTALGISPRTAKFHQQNALRKLGAESRVDLFRLVL